MILLSPPSWATGSHYRRTDLRGSGHNLYWIEAPNGERALPVFTTAEGARQYWKAHSGVRERLEMAETIPTTHQGPLLQNRITPLSLRTKGLAMAATSVGAGYLIRDIREGDEQEILRLT